MGNRSGAMLRKRLARAVATCAVLACSSGAASAGGSCPPASFAEQWYGHLYTDNLVANAPFWWRTTAYLDGAGALVEACTVNTGYVNSAEASASPFAFFEDTATFFPLGLFDDVERGDGTLRVRSGQLANAFVFLSLEILEVGEVFSAADLDGRWYFYSFFDRVNTALSAVPPLFPPESVFLNEPGWTRTSTPIDIASTGATTASITAGATIENDGTVVSVAGAPLGITADGLVDFAGQTYPFRMDSTKTLMLRTTTDAETWVGTVGLIGSPVSGFPGLEILVKGGGNFSLADLEGTWRGQTFFDSVGTNEPGISLLSLTIDDSGALLAGSLEETDSDQATSGLLTRTRAGASRSMPPD